MAEESEWATLVGAWCCASVKPWHLKTLGRGFALSASALCSSSALQISTLSASSALPSELRKKDRQKALLPCYFCPCKADLWLCGVEDANHPKWKALTEGQLYISTITKFWQELYYFWDCYEGRSCCLIETCALQRMCSLRQLHVGLSQESVMTWSTFQRMPSPGINIKSLKMWIHCGILLMVIVTCDGDRMSINISSGLQVWVLNIFCCLL